MEKQFELPFYLPAGFFEDALKILKEWYYEFVVLLAGIPVLNKESQPVNSAEEPSNSASIHKLDRSSSVNYILGKASSCIYYICTHASDDRICW